MRPLPDPGLRGKSETMTDPVISIAMIDDDEDDYIIARDMLEEVFAGVVRLRWFSDAGQARQAMSLETYDVHLVDYRLPGTDGFTVINEMKRVGLPSECIILLTGEGDEDVAAESVNAGLGGYISKKSMTPARLGEAVRAARLRGRERMQRTENKRWLEWAALHDGLTGLLNRNSFMARLRAEVIEFRKSRAPLSLVLLNIDDLKEINAREGHLIGDYIVTETARIMEQAVEPAGAAGRFSCEELAMLLPGTGPAQAMDKARAVIGRIGSAEFPRVSDPAALIRVSACAGAALCEDFPAGAEIEFVRRASRALEEARLNAPGTVLLFDPALDRPEADR